jgi:hypothetical protein
VIFTRFEAIISQTSGARSQPAAIDSVEHYGAGAIAVLWATFVLVVVVGVLGSCLIRDQAFWVNVDRVIGIILWLLICSGGGLAMRHALRRRISTHGRRDNSPRSYICSC